MARSFLDTNILLYCDDRADPRKQAVAVKTWTQLRRSGEGVISIQVLQESAELGGRNYLQVGDFLNTTRKLNLDPALARRRVEQRSFRWSSRAFRWFLPRST